MSILPCRIGRTWHCGMRWFPIWEEGSHTVATIVAARVSHITYP